MKEDKSLNIDPQIVKSMRKKENHTQDSLALKISISTRQIKRIEKGEKTSLSTAMKLCKEFDLNLEQLEGKKPIDKSMSYYWCKMYRLEDGAWVEDGVEEAGRIFGHYNFLINYIADELKRLPTDTLSPCHYKVHAKTMVDKDKNRLFLNIRLSNPRFNSSWNYEFKYEIRPFKFDESGMKWTSHCPVEMSNLIFFLGWGLESSVTEYTTEDIPEVNDPYYHVEFFPQGLNQETEEYLWSKKSRFFPREVSWLHDKAQIANIFSKCDGAGTMEEEYETHAEYKKFLQQFPECRPIGPYYFETIEQVEKFIHEVINLYQPEEIERKNLYSTAIKLKPNVNHAAEEREVVVNFTRVSKRQDKQLPWPGRHRSLFLDNLGEQAKHLNSEQPRSTLSRAVLSRIAAEMGPQNENSQ